MKRPSMQFYPGDWQSNPKLRRCSHGEKGIWLDVLCILHDQDEYGIVRWPLRELAIAVHCKLSALQKLVDKKVLKGVESGQCEPFVFVPRHGRKDGEPVTLIDAQEGPIWYSSRMVRDEYVRGHAGAVTRFGSPERERKRPKQSHEGTERERLRATVWDKTDGRCFHCQVHLDPDLWEIDHFIPRSKGGTGKISNLVPSCRSCNHDKLDTLPSEWGAPCRRLGAGQGDGSSSSLSSSSSTSASLDIQHTLVSPRAGVCVAKSKFSLEQNLQYARASCQTDNGIKQPEAWAAANYANGLYDEMVEAFLLDPEKHFRKAIVW